MDKIDSCVYVQRHGIHRIILRLAGVDDGRWLEQHIWREELVGERSGAGGGDTQRSHSELHEECPAVEVAGWFRAKSRARLRRYLFFVRHVYLGPPVRTGDLARSGPSDRKNARRSKSLDGSARSPELGSAGICFSSDMFISGLP